MNKRQRIATTLVALCIATIAFKITDLGMALRYSASWVVVGALLLYILRDKPQQ